MLTQPQGNRLHLHLIGGLLIIAGVVSWMRFSNRERPDTGAFRSRDALVAANPYRKSVEVSSISGVLVGTAAHADTIEIWSSNKVLIGRAKPSQTQSFSSQFRRCNSANIAIVARAQGRLLTILPGRDISDFARIQLGTGKGVTFKTRFVRLNYQPVTVDLSGEVRVGGVTIPLVSRTDLQVTESGEVTVNGLPSNGFISLGILNKEYAQTFALTDIALRTDSIRIFPNVKVYPSNEISGKIVDNADRPVVGTRVVIDSNIRRFQMPEGRTNKLGRFTFYRIPNGVYSVQAISGANGDMCTTPASGINVSGGSSVDLPPLKYLQGNLVKFDIEDQSNSNKQPVFLEIAGMDKGRTWAKSHVIYREKTTSILVPSGLVKFRASQQPRNGILPSFRNVSIHPDSLIVKPLTSQRVVIKIRKRPL